MSNQNLDIWVRTVPFLSTLLPRTTSKQLIRSVRVYITGSGWASYQKDGTVCGIKLPQGLQEAQKLPEPIYTPSTKAEIGDHDENITYDQSVDYGRLAGNGYPVFKNILTWESSPPAGRCL